MSSQFPTRCRILAVDDEPANLALLTQVLGSEHDLLLARNGQQALDLALAEPHPDLILLDVMMPDMDGFEVCAHLKNDPATADIPVIFVTTLDEHSNEERGFKLGAVDYVTKPFQTSIVHTRVRVHLQLAQHRRLLESLLQQSLEAKGLSEMQLALLERLDKLNS